MIAHNSKIVGEGLTYDDVLLVPAYSDVLPREVSIQTKFTRNITINVPIVSAAMDTVTESLTAITMAQEGGIGVIHKNLSPDAQASEVEKVKKATEIAHRLAPDLMLEGPIQYDAAVDATVAHTKMPDSKVAGKATVFIFPDLNTGNNTYKAVQRSAKQPGPEKIRFPGKEVFGYDPAESKGQ